MLEAIRVRARMSFLELYLDSETYPNLYAPSPIPSALHPARCLMISDLQTVCPLVPNTAWSIGCGTAIGYRNLKVIDTRSARHATS